MVGPTGSQKQSLGKLTRRPALRAALLLCAGILLHSCVPLRPGLVLFAIGVLIFLSALTLGHRIISTALIAITVVLLGIGLAQRENFQFSPNDIGLFATDEQHLTELEVRLIDDPRISAGSPMEQRNLPPKQIATADVKRIKTWNGWIDATGRLPIELNEINPSLQAGQTLRVLGMLQRPRAAMNPGEFNWAAYYRQQRILASFTVRRAGNVHVISDPGQPWFDWLRSKARHLLASGFSDAQASDFALLDAMLLGDRDPAVRDIEPLFQQTGMAYQLSVSGLHIGLFAAIVFWLCRSARLGPKTILAMTTGFVLFYASISLPSHSGIRTAILTIAIATAFLSGRSTDRLQVLSLAAIAMLIWHPMDLYSAGYHLSFAVVIAYALLLPPLREWIKNRDPDAVAKARNAGKTPAQELKEAALVWIMRCAQLSAIAWLATLPLVVYHFGSASSWSIAGSLLLFPLVVLSLLAAALKIFLTLLWPVAAREWAIITDGPIHLLVRGVLLLSRIPASSVSLPTPPLGLLCVYYLLLFAPLLPHRFWLVGRRRWIVRLAPLLGVALIFGSWAQRLRQTGQDEVKLTLLSIGAGQSAVVELPGGHAIMIDAGSTTVSDVAQKVIEPFFRAEGQGRLDEIFLSHGDFDHISATGELATAYGVRQVLTSHHFRKNAVGNMPDQLLLEELDKLNRPPREIAQGDHIDLGSGAAIDVLWPPAVADLNSNNAGLVLRLTYAGRSMLFPADIQDPAFIGVLKKPAALRSDVLVAPHHGSSEDLTPAFLAAVKPQIILSSNFWRLTSKQKRFETMIGQMPLYRTPECGAITVTIHKDGTYEVATFVSGAKPR